MGRILAKKIAAHFMEMDTELERRAGKAIAQIFKEDGEAVFRVMEKNLLSELSFKSGMVVSCGGGVICSEENVVMMKKSGVIVNLFSSAEKIYARTKDDKNRPLLQVDDPLAKIKELLKKREPFYAKADYQVRSEDETPEEVAEVIVKILNNAK